MTRYRKVRGEILTLVQSFLLIVGTYQLKHRRRLVEAIGNRSLGFERGVLGVVGLFVIGLMVAAYLRPPVDAAQTTALQLVEPQPVAAPAVSVGTEPAGRILGLARDLGDRLSRLSAPSAKPAPEQVTADVLNTTFSGLGYDFQSVLSGKEEVPRLFLASLPGDLSAVREVRLKKALFLQSMLPLVLQVNEEIAKDRARLLVIQAKKREGKRLSATDRLWLVSAAARYKVKTKDTASLLARMDEVPVSLALAQAASESGWGTSRFVREGNALFGEWTFSDKDHGLVPEGREEGKTHKVRAFSSLLDSVRAYVGNLNTHRAYRSFRSLRAKLRRSEAPLDGALLAGTLLSYSERGEAYVDDLRAIISANNLDRLDDARLQKGKPVI